VCGIAPFLGGNAHYYAEVEGSRFFGNFGASDCGSAIIVVQTPFSGSPNLLCLFASIDADWGPRAVATGRNSGVARHSSLQGQEEQLLPVQPVCRTLCVTWSGMGFAAPLGEEEIE
jgi:hypothetical protein